MAFSMLLAPAAAHAWWNDEWTFRKRLDIDAALQAKAVGK
jgi:hypothetical protein